MLQERGWDVEGPLPADTTLSGRDPTQPAWADAAHPEWQALRMQAYAAQVEKLDQGVGRIVDALEQCCKFDNTLLVFLSDNGASLP